MPTVNPKYGFVETFDRIPFTGMMEKMWYCRPDGRSVNRSRRKKKRWHLAFQHARPVLDVQPRKLGGPNTNFLNRYGFGEKRHPMDWFTAFMPLMPDDNKEDPSVRLERDDRVRSRRPQ